MEASVAHAHRPTPFDPRALLVLSLGLLVFAFLIDCLLPAGYAMGTVYVGIGLVAFWLPWPRAIWGLAALTTVFVIVGYLLPVTTPFPEIVPSALINRGFAILVIWSATALARVHQRNLAALDESTRRIRAKQARLRSILETSPEAFITTDEFGIVDTFSPSAETLFGYSATEVIGQSVSILVPPSCADRHDEAIRSFLNAGDERIIGSRRVVEGRRKDGSVVPLELAVGQTKVGGRTVFTGFARDLTARQKIEQELRQAHKMEAIGQLTGGIAHDFNNLLTVILGNLEMLEDRLTAPRHLELVREARATTEQGAQLTHHLLAFGRRQPLRPEPTDLRSLLAGLRPILRRTLSEAIEVRMTVDDDTPNVVVDANQLQNALLNLAINARDAMPGGGALTFGVEAAEIEATPAEPHPEMLPGTYAVIAVSDTGVGMSKEVRQKAFEPFFTTKEVGAGTGLGLSMVYGFARQSAGYARIESEPGRGTTVLLYLPSTDGGGTGERDPEPSPRSKDRSRGETILVVEDDQGVRRLTVKRLRDLGYDVLEAVDGREALARMEEEGDDVDLIFSDIVMPGGLTGADLQERVRDRWPGVKVLLTSGYADHEALGRGREGFSWLKKPYTSADLAARLRAVLEER